MNHPYCATCNADTNHGGYTFCPDEVKADKELFEKRWNDAEEELSIRARVIQEMELQNDEYRKMLWWCARKEGLALHIPKTELESIPDGAELLVWYEKLFDSMILKGICSPTGEGTPIEKPVDEALLKKAKAALLDSNSPGWDEGTTRLLKDLDDRKICEHSRSRQVFLDLAPTLNRQCENCGEIFGPGRR